jgi:hypothetical protein
MTPDRDRQPSRRRWLRTSAASLLTVTLPGWASGPAKPATSPAKPLVEVWKDPACGCCGDWITHLQAHGLQVRVHDTGNTSARIRLGVEAKYASCHTALVDGYAIEGHVPAGDIRRLLAERPAALGLAVPGMPIGSPGMDGPAYQGRKDRYEVLLLLRGGGARVYRTYG